MLQQINKESEPLVKSRALQYKTPWISIVLFKFFLGKSGLVDAGLSQISCFMVLEELGFLEVCGVQKLWDILAL